MARDEYTTKVDPLGAAVDRVVAIIRALLPPERAPLADDLGRALGDLFAELIGRAAAQAASVSAPIIQKVEDLEKRERRRSAKLEDLQRDVDGQIDALRRQMPPDLTEAMHRLAVDVEQLKERQAGGDGERS